MSKKRLSQFVTKHLNYAISRSEWLTSTLVILIYILSWKNSTWPSEETAQYFPKQALQLLAQRNYPFDGTPIDGNSIIMFPIGFITLFFQNLLDYKFISLSFQLIYLVGNIVSLQFLLKAFIRNKLYAQLAFILISNTFIFINVSNYGTKSSSFIFFSLATLLVIQEYSNKKLIIIALAISFLTIGMIGNLAATASAYLGFLFGAIINKIEGKEFKYTIKKISLILITNFLIVIPLASWFYYFNSNVFSKYINYANDVTPKFGSNIFMLIGDGNWMQNATYKGVPYYPYIFSYDSLINKFRLGFVIFLLLLPVYYKFAIYDNTARRNFNLRYSYLDKKFGLLKIFIMILFFGIIINWSEVEVLRPILSFSPLKAFRDPWMKLELIFVTVFQIFTWKRIDNISLAKTSKGMTTELSELDSLKKTSGLPKTINLILVICTLLIPFGYIVHNLSYTSTYTNSIDIHSSNFTKVMDETNSVVKFFETQSQFDEYEICTFSRDPVEQQYPLTLLRVSLTKLSSHWPKEVHPTIVIKDCFGLLKVNFDNQVSLDCKVGFKFIGVVRKRCITDLP